MNKYLIIKDEVKEALANNIPVVALESTIISHGMPYPDNFHTALACEKIIRDNGLMKAMITNIETPLQECLEKLANYNEEENLVEKVSCKKIWYSRTANPTHTVVILDLGVKTTLVKKLNSYGLNVIVVPYDTSLEQIKKLKPNGIIISNGPANPNKLNK